VNGRPALLVETCEHCPMEDTCRREGDCRATWDSDAGKRVNAEHRRLAELHQCPYCRQPAGQTCRNDTTGEPLDRQPAHAARLALTRPTTEATP
jgi:hypothetical protein